MLRESYCGSKPSRCFVALILLILCAGSRAASASDGTSGKSVPTIVFMTDFGTVDDSVAICKGVMYSIAPEVRIVDLTHQVTPFSILDGARFLYGTTPYYAPGTIFVVVVDPTVGSTRKAVVVKSKRGQYFVLPDNGLMTLVQDRDGIESAREITNRDWMIGAALSSTFHGRDIFSPVGAHLVRGDDWTGVGPEVDVSKLVRLDIAPARLDEHGLSGEVIATDGPFGNLVTNISGDDFLKLGYARGRAVHVTLGKNAMDIPFVRTFSDVPLNAPLLYIDSRGHLGLAVNQGSFAATYGAKPPIAIFIPRASN
ncbi:MAG TPA: S-adenosyl-l-methionine hydroxide adenosyltransferase family protein [Terriglobales bacterium]|jgi:S-adenosylmethionine hydrolase|nr:S-adenosyl-l-methionine hydroxide adenosyltransferase family protein [Terriglobales bacterium]